MPLDSRVKRFLDALAASQPQDMRDATVEERRLGLAELMKFGGPEPHIGGIEERHIEARQGPIRVRNYTPAEAGEGPLPALVYFHGGGLVAGTLNTHDGIARALANSSGCRVLSVDYRLAPEHPFPAALEDAAAAVEHIAANPAEFDIDAGRLGVCGDSAGGTLAAATVQALARSGRVPLKLQVLLCPILDYSQATPSKRELARGYLVDQATLDHDLRHYAPPGVDPADPRISPLRAAELRGLPRTLIHTAEFDPLRDEGHDYYQRLTRERAQVSYTCHPGMIHLFYGLGGVIPYARAAYEQIGGEIRAAMG